MDSCSARPRPRTAAIRVLILSSHRLISSALPDALRHEGFDVVGAEETIEAAVRSAAATAPDVALLSNRVGDGTGIEACRALREAAPGTRCIIMTTYDERKALRGAALADAAGYIPLSPRTDALADAIRRVAAGGRLHSHEAAMALACGREARLMLRGACEQEVAIWSLVLQGLTNSQISAELALTCEAFAAHLSALLARLGYHPAPEAPGGSAQAAGPSPR